jgi:hypothetical protein
MKSEISPLDPVNLPSPGQPEDDALACLAKLKALHTANADFQFAFAMATLSIARIKAIVEAQTDAGLRAWQGDCRMTLAQVKQIANLP